LKHLYKSLTLIAAITLLAACVTQRKKDEAKGVKLFFHNLQSKYNGYFNANELVRDATEKLEASHVDNFNKILDVYPALAVENPQSASPDLDKATEKVAVVATYHRPSHWVDDCYLLMGKAQYLKHDFESAEETFGYLTEVYNPSLKKKKTKREKEAAAKEAKEDREKAQKEKKKEREAKAKELQKIREETAKEKAKAKEEAAKQAEKDKEARDKELKKIKAQEEEDRKNIQKNKKMTIEERNDARRKANEVAAEERRKAREAKKTDKKTEPVVADPKKGTPQYPDEKKTEIAKTDASKTEKVDKTTDKTDDKKKEEDDKKAIAAKPKGKPDKYLFRHRPCYQEGVVWYARTLTERQSYSDAELLLNKLDRDPKTFKDIRAMSATARAHLYLKQMNYDAAIPALETALSLSKKKKEKVRLAYILAQVYQKRGNNAQAFQMFDKVLDYNPSYEMEFNARLSIALNDDKSTSDQLAAKLLKMGKDDKNADYGGQIYFTLAQIALKKNDKPKCIEYLQASLAAPARNPQQKAEAYYLMATLEYEGENYIVAKAYYDSASTAFAANDARKGTATLYALNLLDVAKNIEIINMQDSLLRIAGMTDKEKREAAVRIKKAQIAASQPKFGPSTAGAGGKISDIDLAEAAKQSRFFGYDRENVKRGKKEFEKKWGTDRRLEDHWNRSNRRSNGDFTKTGSDAVVASEMSSKEIAELLKGVPKTEDDKNAAQDKIDEAMFQLGTLYHDKLKNDKKCIEALEKHLARFPKTKHELEDWYYLYLAHNDLKNVVKAKEYFDRIAEKYPTSMYARLLKNSEDMKKKDEQTVESYYSITYALFKDEKAKEAQDRIPAAETKYGVNNPLKAKFALLSAMCTGRLKGREGYVAALKDVIAKYPDSPEDKRAQEILRILEFGGPINEAPKPTIDTTGQDDLATRFVPSDDKLHYVIVVFSKNMDIEDAKISVSDFNSKYFRTENLNISSIFLSTETEIGVLVVRKFRDKPTSLIYTEGVEKNKKDFLKGEYEIFAVSQDNYREVLRQKTVEHYQRFYNKNYKK
jgi:tetratricopeptide (TPR) repeat protein